MSTDQLLKALEGQDEHHIEIDKDQQAKNLKEAEAIAGETKVDRRMAETPVGGYDHLLTQHFPAQAVASAKKVMVCESGGKADAKNVNRNGSHDSGLFQINDVHLKRVGGDRSRLLDPTTNVKVAADIYREQGWKPWVCARKLKIV